MCEPMQSYAHFSSPSKSVASYAIALKFSIWIRVKSELEAPCNNTRACQLWKPSNGSPPADRRHIPWMRTAYKWADMDFPQTS